MSSFQTALKHIRRSPYQALAAISVMTLTFFVAALVFLVGYTSSVILKHFESKPQITAFLKDEVKINIEELKEKLKATGKVASIRYISKEEALAIYKEQNKNDPLLLEMVTADILPASLEISAFEAKDLAFLDNLLRQEEGVEEVLYQKDLVENLILWVNTIKTIGIFLFSFLAFVSVLIVLTVTGIRIALRKEEIEILKLVGASQGYIRAPFLLEGVIYGLVGGFFAWLVSVLLLLYATPFLKSLLTDLPLNWPPSFLFMVFFLGGLVSAAAGLGAIGSFLAVRRYLN